MSLELLNFSFFTMNILNLCVQHGKISWHICLMADSLIALLANNMPVAISQSARKKTQLLKEDR